MTKAELNRRFAHPFPVSGTVYKFRWTPLQDAWEHYLANRA